VARAVEAVRQERDLAESLIQTAPMIVLLLDAEGRILRFNHKLEQLSGYRLDEVRGQDWLTSFLAEPGRKPTRRQLRRILEGGSDNGGEVTSIVTRDGREIAIEWYATSLADASGGTSVLLCGLDVTERRGMQTLLAQADRMASMGSLAAGVAHEINNPLVYTLYNVESLAEDLPQVTGALCRCLSLLEEKTAAVLDDFPVLRDPELLDDLVERTQDAVVGARRVRELVGDIKTFSRVDEEEAAPVDLQQVISSAINLAFHEIKYRARLVKDFGLTPPVLATDGKLSQVFMNLLVNAAQAIEEDDPKNNEIRVRTWTEGDEVVAEVRDTGCGISTEHLDRLFDPFFTTKPRGEGSGLGLSICRNIVTSFGGQIDVASEPGEGTRFVVRLPALKGHASPQAETLEWPAVREEQARRGRILVVDDEPRIRSALARLFSEHHEVVGVSSGEEAVAHLGQDRRFDVILCDLMMQEGSGMELFEWLEQEAPCLAQRTLFMSGGGVTRKAKAFRDRMSDRMLTKPLDIPLLLRRVAALIEQQD
jgi:PAS domain S-box-containing protein